MVGGRNPSFNYRAQPEVRVARLSGRAAVQRPAAVALHSPLIYDDTSANPPTMGIDCDMTGGSSGGGWIAGGGVASVNS